MPYSAKRVEKMGLVSVKIQAKRVGKNGAGIC
jgi:hypothetical protein